MSKYQANKTSNEEIEAMVDEFASKLETLRVRYEQYFMGIEKAAPAMLRMDVARIMRDLEQVNAKNTALKFKIRQNIQKFTTYSTYWNRVLREIEDGTYKRHLDKAKRTQAAQSESTVRKATKPVEANAKKTQDVADEAAAFLASLGIDSKPTEKPAPAVKPQPHTSPSPVNTSQTQRPAIRRPAIVGAAKPAVVTAAPTTTPAQPAAPTPSKQIVRPAITQPAASTTTAKPVVRPAIRGAATQTSTTTQPVVTRPASVVQPAKPPLPQSQPAAVKPAAPVRPTLPTAPARPAATTPARPTIPARPATTTQRPVPGATTPAAPPLQRPVPPRPIGLPNIPKPPSKS